MQLIGSKHGALFGIGPLFYYSLVTGMEWVFVRMALFIGGVVGTLIGLHLVMCREWVKNDLRERGAVPFSIRWSWLGPSLTTRIFNRGTFYKVRYRDLLGAHHDAWCLVPRFTWGEVCWMEDEITLIPPLE